MLAVSGLHVGFIYAFVMWMLGRCSLRVKSLLTAALLILYAWLTGFSPSIARALILCLMSIMARLCWRASDPMTNLAVAFMLLVGANPMNLVNDGFIMSFTAVLGILLLAAPIARQLGFLPRWLRQSLSVSLAAQMGVAVPVMACYQELPVLGILWNLWVIPATGLLMGLYVLVFLLCWTPLGSLAGGAAAWVTRWYLKGMALAAQIPFSAISTGTPGWPVWVGALVLLVSLSSYAVLRKRYRALWAATGLLLCYLGWPQGQMPPTYIQFSVGQADAAAVMMAGETLLVDTGEDGSDLADYLRAMNRDVDALFLSHLHMDHAGGLAELMENEIKIGACYIAKDARRADVEEEALILVDHLAGMGTPIIELIPGETLNFGEITVDVLGKGRAVAEKQEANETSLALLIEMGGKRILTAGDLPGTMEGDIAIAADVLKVSHHGGANSTGEAFLNIVQPQIGLICCDSGKSLPSSKTLQRLEKAGVRVYRTDESGAVTLAFEKDQINVQPFLP